MDKKKTKITYVPPQVKVRVVDSYWFLAASTTFSGGAGDSSDSNFSGGAGDSSDYSGGGGAGDGDDNGEINGAKGFFGYGAWE